MTAAPLLVGAEAERALDAVEAVVRDLPDPAELSVAGLYEGLAGLALLHLARAELGLPGAAAAAEAAIGRAFELAAAPPRALALASGLTGVAFAAEQLRRSRFDPFGGDDPCAALDAVVPAVLARRAASMPYDLVDGLVGIGVCGRERAAPWLPLVIDALAARAVPRAHGRALPTDPALLPPWQRAQAPQGYDNVGLAHGVPGVVALLAGLDREDPLREDALLKDTLLRDTTAWVRATRGLNGAFPCWIEPDRGPVPTRFAWCYGNPGVARALHLAGQARRDPALVAEALDLARAGLGTPLGVVQDACLCHGAAGLGQVFLRFYLDTGEETFADEARRWLDHALALRRPGEGIGGFLYRHQDPDGHARWAPAVGLLEGAAGVALALLAAVEPRTASWDRALLLSSWPVAP